MPATMDILPKRARRPKLYYLESAAATAAEDVELYTLQDIRELVAHYRAQRREVDFIVQEFAQI